MISFIFESANDVRRHIIRKHGWSEKGRELDSGGILDNSFTSILIDLFDDFHSDDNNKSCIGRFTAGNDNFHKKRSGNHPKGLAVDITLPNSCHRSFTELLKKYKSKYKGFSFIDEYRRPSKNSTGGHFHIEYTGSITPNRNKSKINKTPNSQKNTKQSETNKSKFNKPTVTNDPALSSLLGPALIGGLVAKAFNQSTNESEILIRNVIKEYVLEKKLM